MTQIILYIALERVGWQFPSKPHTSKRRGQLFLGVLKEMIHKEVPALLMLNLHGLYEISDMVKTTDVSIMEEF